MTAPRAYCFDLDGTLIDSEVLWVEAVGAFLAAHGAAIPHAAAEALVYGRSWRDIHRDIARAHPALDTPIADMETELAPYYQRLVAQRDIRIPNSIALLRRLARERPVCIVSGSSSKVVGEAVELMGIGADLRFYLGADDYHPGKPDPACYRLAAQRLGVPASDCLVFEDSHAGVRAAKAAGMRCVVLRQAGRPAQDYSLADAVLSDLGHFDAQRP